MDKPVELAPDLACLATSISNVWFAGTREAWVLVDAGVIGYAERIAAAAAARFGEGARPTAIVLSHGHYDHAGCALELARRWNVPVYAHAFELPYLTGKSEYPRKDPTVGGAMAFLSRFFPARTVNITEVLRELPANGDVPGLPGWVSIPTPGHAPGHVCFWRESDRSLLAGDVVATANLDSWRGIMTQTRRISRPPSPFTYDWEQARASVQRIAQLRPLILGCGHGEPMSGPDVADELVTFAETFSPPLQGRYVETPAKTDRDGLVYEPPLPPDKLPKVAAGIVAGVFLLAGAVYRKRGIKAKQELL
jgi:glyoxylase-like metal-dependent hydrolase (beta-lactamase superfamily II)